MPTRARAPSVIDGIQRRESRGQPINVVDRQAWCLGAFDPATQREGWGARMSKKPGQ